MRIDKFSPTVRHRHPDHGFVVHCDESGNVIESSLKWYGSDTKPSLAELETHHTTHAADITIKDLGAGGKAANLIKVAYETVWVKAEQIIMPNGQPLTMGANETLALTNLAGLNYQAQVEEDTAKRAQILGVLELASRTKGAVDAIIVDIMTGALTKKSEIAKHTAWPI